MPGLVRKLLIFAAVDGLVIQPLGARRSGQTAPADDAVKINYDTHALSSVLAEHGRDLSGESAHFESHGIVGILKVASKAYLISISQRLQVAQLWQKPVYQISAVDIIPITSQQDAQRAISNAIDAARVRQEKQTGYPDTNEPAASALLEVDDDAISTRSGDIDHVPGLGPLEGTHSRRQSVDEYGRRRSSIDTRREPGVAEEVIGRRGAYGRFAERWFSTRGWTTGQRRNMGMSSEDDLPATQEEEAVVAVAKAREELPQRKQSLGHSGQGEEPEQPFGDPQRWPQNTPKVEKSQEEAMRFAVADERLTTSLLPKIVQTTKLLLGSGTFYYSYDFDITRSVSQQRKPTSDLPLYKQTDPQYFYNHHLVEPLVIEGYDELVLPVMQGFVGQRSFVVGENTTSKDDLEEQGPETPQKIVEASTEIEPKSETRSAEYSFLLTLISRRSIKRAGLRYLRRGIDEDGNVANTVETEQVLSTPAWDTHVQSFLQTRGSIPLFFSQTPYTFKPVPVLHASAETNQVAFRKHFTNLFSRYGSIEAVSLIDQRGVEKTIGEAYEEQVELLNNNGGINGTPLGFEWFNFHHVCRGMKFENVSILVQKLLPFLTASSWTVLDRDGGVPSKHQTGIIRTNCMDCLDRTNVVQAAFATTILELQLASMPSHPVKINLTTDTTTSWFNSLWADNGDSISRAYAGTSALKGDYTRTRKRNAFGALNDLSLTLSRYYHNLFDDFFQQAVIDYLLGTVTSAVFSEFEAEMTSADPAIDLRKARESAIAAATHIVVNEEEDVLGSWCLATPAARNSLRVLPFHESLLLLTDTALYTVRYDWDAEKVAAFERIELHHVRAVQCGTYIVHTHVRAQTDPAHNAGLLVRYTRAPETPGVGGDERGDARRARSLDAARDAWSVTGVDGHYEHGEEAQGLAAGSESEMFVAFKALSGRSSAVRYDVPASKSLASASSAQLESDVVKNVSAQIVRAVNTARERGGAPGPGEPKVRNLLQVEERDILSLDEAKRKTGMFEQLGYTLRRYVWG